MKESLYSILLALTIVFNTTSAFGQEYNVTAIALSPVDNNFKTSIRTNIQSYTESDHNVLRSRISSIRIAVPENEMPKEVEVRIVTIGPIIIENMLEIINANQKLYVLRNNTKTVQQGDSAEASTIAVPPSKPSGSPR